MKRWVLLLALVALGCQISPVITDPEQGGSGRYDDCRRAARNYCRDVMGAIEDEMQRCVSEHVFRCVSGSGR